MRRYRSFPLHTTRFAKPYFLGLVVLCLLTTGCIKPLPPHRMAAYLGQDEKHDKLAVTKRSVAPAGPVKAGLLVINDTKDPGTAPPYSPGLLSYMTDQVRKKVESSVPISVTTVLNTTDVAPNGDLQHIVGLAKAQAVDYMVFAIFSSSEVEFPTYLAFGAATPASEVGSGEDGMPGFRAENYALVEIALLDVQTGQVLVHSDGRAWAYLLRLNVATESNNYPVVRHARLFSPIFPEEENAHDVLRQISGSDALDQVLLHFKEAWNKNSAS